jgi:transposase InsO family protein
MYVSKAREHQNMICTRLNLCGLIHKLGVESSVDSRGRQLRQALTESVNVLCRAEPIHRRTPGKTRAAVGMATLDWVSWLNHRRLVESISYISPAEAGVNYYQRLAEKATVEV